MITPHPTARFRDFSPRYAKPLGGLPGAERPLRFTFKARAAIEHYLRGLKGSLRWTVLLPAFHCATVVQPVLRAGFKVRFYGINADLSVDVAHLNEQFGSDVAAVVLIHYFGFMNDTAAVAAVCRGTPARFIEDWLHSFVRAAPLRFAGEAGDVAVYSPWKLVPCGTGGLIRAIKDEARFDFRMSPAPVGERLRLYKRMVEEAFLHLDEGATMRRVFEAAERWRLRAKPGAGSAQKHDEAVATLESTYPERDLFFNSAMPTLSKYILAHYDIAGMVARRRHNYASFARLFVEGASVRALFPDLDSDTVPWGFPVLLRGRAGRDRQLRAAGVPFFTFGEILHPALREQSLPPHVLDTAEALAAQLICFSIHQDTDPERYANYCELIKSVADQAQ